MGDLFTLPQDVDTQVSPLYRKKVQGRQSRQYNNEIGNLDTWAASFDSPTQPQTPQAAPKAKNGYIKDTALGALGGVRNGVQEMAESLVGMRNWLANQMNDKLGTDYYQKELAGKLPEVSAPQHMPGQLVSGITQFLTGFIPGAGTVGKIEKGAKALSLVPKIFQQSPKLLQAAKGMAAGAFADATAFDPHTERLSNLVEQFPQLSNPISSYLAAKPGDSEAEGRFKNTLEGMGLGLAVEGLLHGVRYLKGAKEVKPSVKDSFEEALRGADEAAEGVAKEGDIASKIREEESVASRIDAAENAARAEEQRLTSYMEGSRYGEVADAENIKPLLGGEGQYGDVIPNGGKVPEIDEVLRGYEPKGMDVPVNQIDSVLSNYTKSLGHDSVDSFLNSIKGFTRTEAITTLFGGTTGGLVGGKTDLTGDGEVTFADVAAGFVLGAGGMAGGMKAIGMLKASGKTEAQAIKELTTEKVAQLDAVIAKVKGAMNTGTLDEKTMAKLQDHLDTLQKFKGEVKNVKAGTIVNAIKDNEVKIQFKEGSRASVSFKEDAGALDNLYEAIAKGDRAAIAEGMDVNFAHIQTEDDIKNILNLVADKMGTPKSSVRSEEMVKSLADDLGFTEESLKAMAGANKGTANLDSKIYAVRGLLLKSAEELKLKAEAFKANPADDNLIIALRKQMVIHAGIQRSLSETRTEVGRALRSFQMVSESLGNTRELEGLIAQYGGKQKNAMIADHVLELIKNGETRGLNQYARAIDGNPKLQAVLEYYINSLLSSPATWAVNALTNTMTTLVMPSERLLAGAWNMAKGGDGMQIKQAQAMFVGMSEGIKDAWRMAAKSWAAEGEGILDPLIKIEGVHYKSISSDALGANPEGVLGKAIDFLGTVIRTPGRILGSGDEFFKVINARMSLNEQLFMESISKAEMQGLTGDALAKATAEAMQNLKNNVPTSIMEKLGTVDKSMHDAVIEMARYNTFTNNLSPAMQGVQKGINSLPVAKFFIPFFKVPVNILKYAHERTPIINLWSKDIRAQLTHSDPSIRDLAQAKLATGSMVYGTAALLYSQGLITGRNVDITKGNDSSANDIAGKPAYSIKIGDTWYSYNRLDPVGMMLGLATDVADILGHSDEATSKDLTVAAMAAIGKNITSKTYLQGISNLVEALDSPSPNKMKRLLGSLIGTVAPSGGYAALKAVDPVAREANDLIDYVYRRTPGLSSDLPAVRNIFGEEVRLKPGYGMDSMSPVYTSKETDDPVKQEFMRLGVSSQHTMQGMKKINGVELTPAQKDRYIQLMGKPLKSALDKLVSSPRYERMSENIIRGGEVIPGGKADSISNEITRYKSRARIQLLREYPELKDEIRGNKRFAKEAKKDNSNWIQEQLQQ